MKRSLIKKKISESEGDGSFELDLAPMLALMVCLIPIMLLATALVQVKVIETPLPQVVKEAIENDRNQRDQKPKISLFLRADKTMQLMVTIGDKQIQSLDISNLESDWNLDSLYSRAVGVKSSYPDIFHISVIPEDQVSYNNIVLVIDTVRRAKSGGSKFKVRSKEGDSFETDLIFPEVMFANVMEGV